MEKLVNGSKNILLSLLAIGSVSAYAENTIDSLSAYNNEETITFEANGYFSDEGESHVRFFIDSDNDPDTGYSDWRITGADHRVKDNRFYEFNGGGWRKLGSINTSKQEDYISSEVPLNLLDSGGILKFTAVVMDSDWGNWEIFDEMVSYEFDYGSGSGSENYSESVLNTGLQYQLIGSGPEFVDKDEYNDFYYFSDSGVMTFEISEWQDVQSKRIELRSWNEWGIDSNTNESMAGVVGFTEPAGDIDEITWMQLHHKDTGAKPFVRLAWKDDKNGHTDSLGVVIRKSDTIDAEWHYLGGRPDSFFTSSISIEDETLTIVAGTSQYSMDVPPFWKNANNYFKAGMYFSGRSEDKSRDATVQFSELYME
jgi:hypothetical protein